MQLYSTLLNTFAESSHRPLADLQDKIQIKNRANKVVLVITSATSLGTSEDTDKGVYLKPDQMPVYDGLGSLADFRTDVMGNIQYPGEAREKEIVQGLCFFRGLFYSLPAGKPTFEGCPNGGGEETDIGDAVTDDKAGIRRAFARFNGEGSFHASD